MNHNFQVYCIIFANKQHPIPLRPVLCTRFSREHVLYFPPGSGYFNVNFVEVESINTLQGQRFKNKNKCLFSG